VEALPKNLDETFVEFLSRCNGGYTSDGFFHLFGCSGGRGHNIFEWNNSDLWKKYYGLDDNFFAFAEDIFGDQYGFDLKKPSYSNGARADGRLDFSASEGEEGNIKILFVDTGKLIPAAPSFEDFIEICVLDPDEDLRGLHRAFVETTRSPVPVRCHIAYRHPLVLGGSETDLDNLELSDSASHLRLLGQIVTQTRLLPRGTRIKDVLVDKEKGEVKLLY
jgi:hypothetical protein